LLIATFSEARGNGWGNDPLSSVHVWPLAVLVPDALHADRSVVRRTSTVRPSGLLRTMK
jgi:hypothetical protein